jgi:hypothetical protein
VLKEGSLHWPCWGELSSAAARHFETTQPGLHQTSQLGSGEYQGQATWSSYRPEFLAGKALEPLSLLGMPMTGVDGPRYQVNNADY